VAHDPRLGIHTPSHADRRRHYRIGGGEKMPGNERRGGLPKGTVAGRSSLGIGLVTAGVLLVAALGLAACDTPTAGKPGGQLTGKGRTEGTVGTGASVPVTLTHGNGTTYLAATTNTGHYSFVDLPCGSYDMTAGNYDVVHFDTAEFVSRCTNTTEWTHTVNFR
jgi:hypothetical protein